LCGWKCVTCLKEKHYYSEETFPLKKKSLSLTEIQVKIALPMILDTLSHTSENGSSKGSGFFKSFNRSMLHLKQQTPSANLGYYTTLAYMLS
jgi:hypothetical protein